MISTIESTENKINGDRHYKAEFQIISNKTKNKYNPHYKNTNKIQNNTNLNQL